MKGERGKGKNAVRIARTGVPIVAQWKRIRLGTMRLQVQSMALLSGLRIQRYCGCGVGEWLQLRLEPQPENLHMLRVLPKKTKDRKKINKNKNNSQNRFRNTLQFLGICCRCLGFSFYSKYDMRSLKFRHIYLELFRFLLRISKLLFRHYLYYKHL